MRIRELRVGSIVKYKDLVCTIVNINGSNGMLYLNYNKDYYCGASVKDVEPMVIDEMTLEDSGFIKNVPGQWSLSTEKFNYRLVSVAVEDENDKCFVLTILSSREHSRTIVRYWHQLQMITGMYED